MNKRPIHILIPIFPDYSWGERSIKHSSSDALLVYEPYRVYPQETVPECNIKQIKTGSCKLCFHEGNTKQWKCYWLAGYSIGIKTTRVLSNFIYNDGFGYKFCEYAVFVEVE